MCRVCPARCSYLWGVSGGGTPHSPPYIYIEKRVQSLRRCRRDKVHLRFYLFLRPHVVHDVPAGVGHKSAHQETIYLHRTDTLLCTHHPRCYPHHSGKTAAFWPMKNQKYISIAKRKASPRGDDHDRAIALRARLRLGQTPRSGCAFCAPTMFHGFRCIILCTVSVWFF